MTYAVLKLVHGTHEELDFLDGVNYRLKSSGWAPSIATRDHGLLGGRGYFVDVPEQIEINLFGDNLHESLRDVVTILDQADAWHQGEDVDPVLFHIQMQNTALTEPLQAIITGKDGTTPFMSSPSSFSDLVMSYEIDGAVITFRRRGQLLSPGETEDVTFSGSDVTNPAVATINSGLAVLDIPSPTLVKFTDLPASAALMGAGFLLMTGVSPASAYGTNFGYFIYSDMTSSEFSTVAETTYHATGGNVKRIDAASNTSGTLSITVNAEVVGLTVFVKVRNNHATTTWRMRARSTGFSEIPGRWKVIDASTTNPRAEVLGLIQAVSNFHEKIHIDVETDGSVGTLDVNVIAILPHDEDTNYIGIMADDYSSDGFARNIAIDHKALTAKRPLVYVETAE